MKWLVGILLSIFFVSPALAEVRITIDLSEQMMIVDAPVWDTPVYWDVSTAKKGMTTPTGNFQPTRMEKMHYSSKYENAPMPYSIFFTGGYAIHGTNAISQLGKRASHGCVRLHPENARILFSLVSQYGKDNTFIEIVP